MSEYSFAKDSIEKLVEQGQGIGLDRAEMLDTLIISAIDDYQRNVGVDEVRVLLTYELDNMGGTLDMVNLRAR